MLIHGMLLATSLLHQVSVEPAHRKNQVYALVVEKGMKVDGETITLPRPLLLDAQDAEEQRAALSQVAGSDSRLEELFRDSITAPYIIKVHDRKAPEATIRAVDLWFVVYADLKEADPAQEAARTDQKEVEAANMWFRSRILKADELRAAGIQPRVGTSGEDTWYGHLHARLLDRIEFEVTNQVVATQSKDSIVVASHTDPAFDKKGPNRNFWKAIAKPGTAEASGSATPYPGGISYAKISRVAFKSGALLVEMHAAFVEPTEWFSGAPILRSKFSVVAQDQIRSLRRELARKRKR
jgi:hypothetical protein